MTASLRPQGDSVLYIDSNAFIYAAVNVDAVGKEALQVLSLVQKGALTCVTSCLTVDEVVWNVSKLANRNTGIERGRDLFSLKNLTVADVTSVIVLDSLAKMEAHSMGPRDAIHLSTMLTHGIFTIISEDGDFDRIENITRLSFAETIKKFSRR